MIDGIAGGQSGIGEGGNHYGESLQPHAHSYRDGCDHGSSHGSGFSIAKKSKRYDKTGDKHGPEIRDKRSGQFGIEDGHVHRISAIESGQIFGKGEIEP